MFQSGRNRKERAEPKHEASNILLVLLLTETMLIVVNISPIIAAFSPGFLFNSQLHTTSLYSPLPSVYRSASLPHFLLPPTSTWIASSAPSTSSAKVLTEARSEVSR